MEMDSKTDVDQAADAEQAAVDVEAILGGLDTHEFTRIPAEAIRQCQQHRELMTPHLIRQIELATEQIRKDKAPAGDGHWIALYLLWEFQAQEALPTILAALQLPGEAAYDMFGDDVSEDLPQVLATLAGDQRDLIDKLIGDSQLDEFVRWAAASSYAYLVRDGSMPRAEAVDRLRRHLRIAIEQPGDSENAFLIFELIKFNPQEAAADIREAFDREIVHTGKIDREYVEQLLAAGEEASKKKLAQLEPTLLADTVEYLLSREYFQSPEEDEDLFESPEDRLRFERQWQAAKRDVYSSAELEEEPVYTESATIRNEGPRIGRNDPCPCGSGKKYKKCCLRSEPII